MFQPDHPGTGGGRSEQVGFRTEQRNRRSDDLLTNRIDRRIGHLGKQLLEVVVQQL